MDFTGLLLSTLGDIIKNKHLCFLTIEIRNHRNHQRLQVLFWLRFGTHRSRRTDPIDPGGVGCREPTSWPWFLSGSRDAATPRGGEPLPRCFVVSVSCANPQPTGGAPSPQWQLQLVLAFCCFVPTSFDIRGTKH